VVLPNVPAAHPRQELIPVVLAKKPAAHSVQLAEAFTALKLPAEHSRQAEKLLWLKKPGVQKSQTERPGAGVK
jgi:hypothetical protein